MRAIIPLMFSVSAIAEPLSNHNEPHAGIQAAIDRLDAAGCTRYQVSRSGQYVLHSTQDPNTYELVGNTITIRCVRPSQPAIIYHDLRWQPPTEYDNGAQLNPDDISHYEIDSFLGIINVGIVNSYSFGDVGDDAREYRLRTVLKNGQMSEWSETVVVDG